MRSRGAASAIGWLPLTCCLAMMLPCAGQEGRVSESGRSPGDAKETASTGGEDPYLWYVDRSLEPQDFWKEVPEKRPLEEPRIEAYSHTELRYRFESQTRRRGSRYTADLMSISVHALFDRSQSWNAQPGDLRLLDHHQGHFDLAEIAAREAERQLRLLTRPPQRLIGRGMSEPEAVRDLDRQIQEHLAGHAESLKRDLEYFDQVTRYGTLPEVEARERQKHKQLLERSLRANPARLSP